jgi:hypothetical protein
MKIASEVYTRVKRVILDKKDMRVLPLLYSRFLINWDMIDITVVNYQAIKYKIYFCIIS